MSKGLSTMSQHPANQTMTADSQPRHDSSEGQRRDQGSQRARPSATPQRHTSSQNENVRARKWPQTPVRPDKLDFADLIANPEDEFNKDINATPLDQIDWKQGPSSSATSSTRLSQRRKRRARSTSPSESERRRRLGREARQEIDLDSDGAARSFKTPRQEDPLMMLWDRYTESLHRENTEPILPALAPLSSSPNTPGTSKKSDFRRTASCGIEWPTSENKRRKLNGRESHARAKGIFALNKGAILNHNQPKASRVGMLVDSIHQSLLQKTIPEENAPASSSPLPEVQERLSASVNTMKLGPHLQDDREAGAVPEPEDIPRGSSEFGDMDFDVDDPELLDVLDKAATQSIPSPLRKAQQAPAIESESRPMSASSGRRPAEPSTRILGAETADLATGSALLYDSDEFDDDDDAFATELAELADKVESQNQGRSQMAWTTISQRPISNTDGIEEFADAFDNDDDNDLWDIADNSNVRLAAMNSSQKNDDHRTIKRYMILEVHDGQYKDVKGRVRPEQMLSIKDENTRRLYLVHLRQSWYDTRCTKGAYIHLIGDFDRRGECIVDDQQNMVILHPDHLISATVVADSFSCTRRAILQDRIKATSPPQAPQVYGHLIHEVFGELLRLNKWTAEEVRPVVDKLIPNYLESLYEINVSPFMATEYVMSKMPELMAWASVYVSTEIDFEGGIRDHNDTTTPTAINKLLELEEHVWSPMYGLKGNIDATVQAKMRLPGENFTRTLTVPLELKTGKRDSNEMHRAQTALYTLLLSDRYDLNITTGILYYLETSKMFRVEGIRNEIRHMIIQRNELACFVHDKLALPPMLKREHLCKKCYAQTSCFTYHKLVEDGNGDTSGMKQVFDQAVGHLRGPQQDFFKKWDELLTKEERDAMKFKRELWTMLSSERELVGRCFANVVIEPGSAMENMDSPKINRHVYSFVKRQSTPRFSFTESQITVGEPIVISDEKGHFALANGFVTNIRPSRITVAVDRRLQNARKRQPGFDAERNQAFSAIMEVGKEGAPAVGSTDPTSPVLFRIDKDEFANGMAVARNNIIRIMEKDLWRARELRQLIIEMKAPVFKPTSSAYELTGPASQQNLNVDQTNAIQKVMSAKDYALVLGMPGTGKTTTIAHIIRALVAKGKSVLLTSYTHTAVDNILLKIKDDNIQILRLGALGKIHPDVQNFADLGGVPKKTVVELEKSWMESKVVATTCLGINHAIFNHRTFDYCIVDEASQITLPVCLGPIRLASTFILVGDHYQLPPLVQNKEAQEGGLDISLFKRLSDAQPSSVVNLEHQYRMADDIMQLSNELVYNGRLKCGTMTVALRVLQIPRMEDGMEAHHHSSSTIRPSAKPGSICDLSSTSNCWLRKAVSPENRVIFLNTDKLSSDTSTSGAAELRSGNGNRITNPAEAAITAQILTTLIRSGVAPASIGVITFYRSQLALLRAVIKSSAGTTAASSIEMHTADKYQGRDKEVILLSCVRSNEANNVGDLLKDWRRVNVALTRAKSKLVIIGSEHTLRLSGVPILTGLTDVVNRKGWLFDLPANATEQHFFEGQGTQTQLSQMQIVNAIVASQQQQQRPSRNFNLDSSNHDPTQQPSHPININSRKRPPLRESNGNAPAKRHDPTSKISTAARSGITKVTRQPLKTIHGAAPTVDIQGLLDRGPVTENIVAESGWIDDEDEDFAF